MKEIKSSLFQYRGSHYEMGKSQGQALKNSILFSQHKQQLRKDKQPRFIINHQEAETWIKRIMPNLWEELTGLAEGLELSLNETVTLYSGYQQEWTRSGCSILTTKEVLVRNYDFHPKTYEGRFIVFQPEDGYATIGPAQRLTGRTDGMNEKGLTAGYNFVNRRRGGDGFIPTVILRMLLETCSTSKEAIDLIKEIPHRHTFNFVISDKTADSYVIEASPRELVVIKNNYCTNHFESLTEDNRYHMADSLRRAAILERKREEQLTPAAVFQLFNQKKYNIYSEDYSNWAGTIHTSLYNPIKGEVWFAIGADKLPVVLSFNDWIGGKNFPFSRFRGMLNTKESLPFMDEA